ncbi:FAD-dependent oxidoreductase [[Actinomadura] parvosata]|uniref:FAD-dependent oxidoreductase n=1 Tax=[Actinomadura] parvosata TaxID=1955412 RepID=UPI00406CD99B
MNHSESRQADLLVVGAGPAGAAAAIEATRHGLHVVICDPGQPRPPADVIVSEAALGALTALDVARHLPLRPLEAVELRLGAGPARRLPEAAAALCDRADLDTALRHALADLDLPVLRGSVETITVEADGLQHAAIRGTDAPATVAARHVIVAGGPPPAGTGVACTQLYTGAQPANRLLLMLPAPRTIDPAETPTCVWAAPAARAGTFTLGVARLGPANPDFLLEQARAALLAAHPELAGARPCGPPRAGVLNSAFAPERVVDGGRLLVGDAAGLSNPFTGEGISYAAQSGVLAAQAVAAHPSDPQAAAAAYRRTLSRTFVGYFETARHASQRYHLAWRVLAATAHTDRPVFAKVRRVVLLPEGFSNLTAAERMRLDSGDHLLLAPFLLACDEVAISTVRREWPFIARLLIAGDSNPHRRLRPAAAFLGALTAAGAPPDITHATLAAAIELATLGALTFLGPMPDQPQPGRLVDWSITGAVLAGDFLLGQATRLVAACAPEMSWSFADWLADLAAHRSHRLQHHTSTPASALFAALLEFPARIGGRLGGAPAEVIDALRTYGEQCGHVFLHAEDALALRGRRTRLDVDLPAMMNGRISAITDLLGEKPICRRQALEATTAAGTTAAQAAHATLTKIPHEPAARILRAFLDALASPLTPTRPGDGTERDRAGQPVHPPL